MDGIDQQIEDTWAQRDALALSLQTTTNEKEIQRMSGEAEAMEAKIDDLYAAQEA